MTRHVYVGNLSPETTSQSLRSAFEAAGRSVTGVSLVRSPRNGRPRGFGFVELASSEEAEAAIRELDGKLVDGKAIKVSEGKERPEIRLRSVPETFSRGRGGRGGRR
jgi:RNA recognition motif-containing protein